MITIASQQTTQQTRRQTMLPLLALCLGYFMTILDVTIVNIALVDIKEHLGANVTGLQWIVDGYALVFASLLLTGGALGDRRGSRTIFLVGFALFTLASTLCSLAPSLLVLQIARAFQGLGAALLVPNSLALLNTIYTDARKRAQAIGIWAAVASIGALSGPLLGGVLVKAFGWRSIFLINLPIGILGFLLTARSIAPSTPQGGRSLDLPGQVAGVLALGLLTFALIEGNSLGILSPLILAAYAGSVLFFLLLLLREKTTSHPMLPLKLFQERTFSATNVVAICQTFTFTGFIFVISLFLQEVKHYPPSLCRSGFRTGPGLTVNDRGCDFACTQSPVRDSSGNAQCKQASWRCHWGRNPGNAGEQSADVPPRDASRLCDCRRRPPPRVGLCMGLRQKTRGTTLTMMRHAHACAPFPMKKS